MAFVIVRLRSTMVSLYGQTRLGAVNVLNMALLVRTPHRRVVGRIEVQFHHIGPSFYEPLIGWRRELLCPMLLQAMRTQNMLDGNRAEVLCFHHATHAPMRPGRWMGVQRGGHDRLYLRYGNPHRTSMPGRVLEQALPTVGRKALPPEQHSGSTRFLAAGHVSPGVAFIRHQDRPGTQDHLLRPILGLNSTTQNLFSSDGKSSEACRVPHGVCTIARTPGAL